MLGREGQCKEDPFPLMHPDWYVTDVRHGEYLRRIAWHKKGEISRTV
jgi:hypothetical protein